MQLARLRRDDPHHPVRVSTDIMVRYDARSCAAPWGNGRMAQAAVHGGEAWEVAQARLHEWCTATQSERTETAQRNPSEQCEFIPSGVVEIARVMLAPGHTGSRAEIVRRREGTAHSCPRCASAETCKIELPEARGMRRIICSRTPAPTGYPITSHHRHESPAGQAGTRATDHAGPRHQTHHSLPSPMPPWLPSICPCACGRNNNSRHHPSSHQSSKNERHYLTFLNSNTAVRTLLQR